MEFPLQYLYSNKIKMAALSPLDDKQTSHFKNRRTDTHHMSIMQSHFNFLVSQSVRKIYNLVLVIKNVIITSIDLILYPEENV